MSTLKPLVVPALAGMLPLPLKTGQQTAQALPEAIFENWPGGGRDAKLKIG